MQKESEIGSKSGMEEVMRETMNMVGGEIGSGGMANPHHGNQQTRGVCVRPSWRLKNERANGVRHHSSSQVAENLKLESVQWVSALMSWRL